MNDRLNRAVRESLADVDAVVLVLDATRITPADHAVVALLPASVSGHRRGQQGGRAAGQGGVHAAPRGDRRVAPVRGHRAGVGGEGHATRRRCAPRSRRSLPQSPPLYPEDDLTDRDERFLAAEFVREKIFRLLGDEVPYATTVGIDKFEMDGELRRIHATVYVDKAGQRAILLGEGGARMKAIASQARGEMEKLFGGPVFLEVWVRVKSGWADTDASLAKFGY